VVYWLFRTSGTRIALAAMIIGFLAGALYWTCCAKMASKGTMRTIFLLFLAATILIGTRQSLIDFVRPSINEALQGRAVRLIQLVDFQAAPAHIVWLNPEANLPKLLQDPYLLYLGHGPRGEVLLACGNVVTVPSDLIIVADGFHLNPQTTDQTRNRLCKQAQKEG
jgi:hypothetical protein